MRVLYGYKEARNRMQSDLAKTRFDLTCSQDQIYLGQRHFGRTPEYNLTFAYGIPGRIDQKLFRQAFDCMVREADCLRMRVEAVEGRAEQWIQPDAGLELEVIDFSSGPDPRGAYAQWAKSTASAAVDVDCLVQGSWLAILDAKSAEWVITVHHLAADGWALSLLYRRLVEIYAALLGGQEPPQTALLPLSLLLEADQAYRGSADFRADHLYWRQKMARATGPVLLYGSAGNGFPSRSRRVEVELDRRLARGLVQLAGQPDSDGENPTIRLFNLLLTAYAAYLYRASGQEELMIGVPYLNRPGNFRQVPGLTKGVVPLLVSIGEADSFRDLFRALRAESAGAARHSRYPVPDPSNRLFNTVFNFHNRFPADDSRVETWWHSGSDAIDLTLNILNPNLETGQIRLGFDLSYDVFPDGQEEKIIRHFLCLLHALVEDMDGRILDAAMLSEQERSQVVHDFNPPAEMPPGRLLADRLAGLAGQFPGRTAVESAVGKLSYARLDELSIRLARYLRRRGARPGTAVGLHASRSPEMIAAFLAIFRTGAAFVPLDPAYPPERLAYMIADAGIELVLASRDVIMDINTVGTQVLVLEDICAETGDPPEEILPLPAREDCAYINYTSGSTGHPKGVMISQGALANYLDAITACFELAPDDRFLFFSAQGSDAVYEEILPILLAGGTLVLKPEKLLTFADFDEIIAESNLTVLSLPAAYWGEWVAELVSTGASLPETLRMMLVYAEEPSLQRYLEWRKLPGANRVRWINTYGPTETTITTSIYEPDPGDDRLASRKRMPVGFPLPNHHMYILDRKGNPVAQGVPGEIVIAGGVGIGYRNRPEETAARFVADTVSAMPAERMYRTGDRGRHLPDGSIEFLGRMDTQIKLNGFRIEPGEIENCLTAYPGVRQAAVAVRENGNHIRRLAAYLTLETGVRLEVEQLRAFLRKSLPEYMVPADFVFLEEMPVNVHGKLDRLALPKTGEAGSEAGSPDGAAQTTLEGQILTIWDEVLGISSAGVEQDFFELGGNSLLGVRLFAQLEHRLGLRLPVSELFQSSTVRKLAGFIETHASGYKPSTLVLIRPGGPGRPLFLIHGWGGGVVDYADLARSIAPRWPIYGLQAAGLTREEPPDTTIEAMVNRYVTAIKTVQPQGPYRLGGYCTGGVIAYALACRLEELGERADVVAIIEGDAPGVAQSCPPVFSQKRVTTILDSVPYWVQDYRQLGLKGIRQRILLKLRDTQRARKSKQQPVEYQMEDIILDNPTPLPDIQKEILLVELRMMENYVPRPFSGRVSVYTSRYPTISGAFSGPLDPTMGWTELARGGVSIYTVNSSHRNIHLAPNSTQLGRYIQEEMEKADAVLEADRVQSSSL